MTTILALPILYQAVQDRFTAESTPATFTFGWREPSRQAESLPRLVWVPGDDGNLGDLVPPRYAGAEPERALANLDELFTIYIDAADTTDATTVENDLAQYTACRLLFDALYRAFYLAASITVEVKSARWMPRGERPIGAALRVVASVQAVIPDAPLTYAPDDTKAHVTSIEGSTTDQVESIPS